MIPMPSAILFPLRSARKKEIVALFAATRNRGIIAGPLIDSLHIKWSHVKDRGRMELFGVRYKGRTTASLNCMFRILLGG